MFRRVTIVPGSSSIVRGNIRVATSSTASGRERTGRITRKEDNCLERSFSEIPTVEDVLPFETRGVEEQSDIYQELIREHGPVFKKRNKSGSWTVVAHGPETAETMYRAEGRCPSRGRLLSEVIERIHKQNQWRPSMAFASGEEWKRIRTAARQQATPKWTWQHIGPLCKMADSLMEDFRQEGERVEDIRSAVVKWAYQGTAFFVLGENVDVYSNGDHTHQAFMKIGLEFTKCLKALVSSTLVSDNASTQRYREFVETTNTMRQQGRLLMEGRYQKMRKGKNNGTGVFEEWVREGSFSVEEAAALCSDLLASSFEATSNTATFLLFELAKQPSLQDKLHKEIQDTLGERSCLTSEDLQRTSLLRGCVKETLRLYPPMAVGKREAGGEMVVNGYGVPAGTDMHVTMGLMSHDCRYFKQPMEFRPERWSDVKTIQPFSCLPFGFGPRGCYGRRYAEAQLYTLLFRVITQYRLQTEKQELRVEYCSGLTPAEPVPLNIAAR